MTFSIKSKKFRSLLDLDFEKTSVVTVLGKNKLNIYYCDKLYQVKSNKRFNALKYVNVFYKFKNRKETDNNGDAFLGL